MAVPAIPTVPNVARPVPVAPGLAAPKGTVFAQDTFTDVNGTLLTAHAAELGGPWVKHPAVAGTFAVQGNRAVNTGGAVYFATAAPAGADYDVTADLVLVSDNGSSQMGVVGRCDPAAFTCYRLMYLTTTDVFRLDKLIGGAATTLASGGARISSGSRTITLRLRGKQIACYVNGVLTLGPISDVDIAAAGQAGVDGAGTTSGSAGVNLDNFLATNA